MSTPQFSPQTHRVSSMDLGSPPSTLGEPEDDTLPPYSNNIRLASLCRRKREFHAAFDKTRRGLRNWELVWLVLDGTALRVYEPRKEEKRTIESTDVGLMRASSGDSTRSSSNLQPCGRLPRVHSERGRVPMNRQQPTIAGLSRSLSTPLVSSSEPQLQHIRSRDPRTLVDETSREAQGCPAAQHRRLNSISKGAPIAPPAYQPRSWGTPHGASTPFLASAVDAFSGPGQHAIGANLPDFSKRKACRQYHLQHAVCMKADAYTKRDHVLRFILEDGKQFLVQLSGRTETVAWLQLMSIAAPLSLDLDERPMPEPAHYPRRRPRTRANRRPSTAPGALETGTPVAPPLLVDDAPASIIVDTHIDPLGAGAIVVGGEGDEVVVEEEEVDDGQEMDHLPPPRRPVITRSLSSVEQARRRGIQL